MYGRIYLVSDKSTLEWTLGSVPGLSRTLPRSFFFWSVIFGTAARGRRNETEENRRFSDERCLRAMMMLMMPYDVVATLG